MPDQSRKLGEEKAIQIAFVVRSHLSYVVTASPMLTHFALGDTLPQKPILKPSTRPFALGTGNSAKKEETAVLYDHLIALAEKLLAKTQ